ncbi:MAG: hypothetical protein ACI86M_000136 [Saprospiraceae bacterium]|jgi:hypothetical protein
MKILKYLSLVLILSFVSTSCDDSLDINTNPLAATTADPNVVLPFVLAQYSNRHVTELGTRTMDVPQHFTACFNSPRQGSTSIFLTGNTWSMMYTQVLGNLLLVENDAAEAGPSSNNINAIAKILKANVFFELTSIWEDVPFTEALNAIDFPKPLFDKQEDVLRGAVDILDEAMALIDAIPADGVFDVTVGDIIYGGDMVNWRVYANSLKLRVLMVLKNKVDVSSQIAGTLAQPLMESNDQAALVLYSASPGGQNGYNQLVEAFFGISNEDQFVYAPSETLFNLLEGDPRFDMIIANPDAGTPIAMGMFANPGDPVIADNVIRDDLPHMLMMPAEISLYRAELAMESGDMTTANAQYKNGVALNVAWWGGNIPDAVETIPGDTQAAFVDGLAAPTLEDIYNQLYIESFIRPVVAWNTVRRTKTPSLDAVPGAIISTILKRYNYPPNEVASNSNTPVNLPTDTPMWFEN